MCDWIRLGALAVSTIDDGWKFVSPHAVSKRMNNANIYRRINYCLFQSKPRLGWKTKTNRKMAVAVSTMADPETILR